MSKTVRIFVSYSHKDRYWQETLMPMLTFPGVQVQSWSDKDMKPGIAWHTQIQDELAEMDIFLPLVSPNFAVSNYIMNHECRVAKERHDKGEIEVLPVVISEPADCDCPWIMELQYVPKLGRSWVQYRPRLCALKPIREGMREVVDRVLENES